MTRGRVPSHAKRVFRPTRSHTHGVAVGYCIAPRRSGAPKRDHPNVASNGFVGASGCSPFFPGIGCKVPIVSFRFIPPMSFRPFPINVILGHPPLSFRAQREILARKPRFLSRSLSHLFEAGSFEMTMGWIPSQTKRGFRTTRSHTHGVAVGYCIAPRRSGAQNHDHLDAASYDFVGTSGRSPFFPGICCTAPDSLYWFPTINANSIVVRLIDFYELRLPRRLRLLAMTMLSCVSLRAKRRNLVTTCENDYIPSPGLRPPSPPGRGLG
jgi:hypothetical protein